MWTVCFSGLSLLFGLYATISDSNTGTLRISLEQPASIYITDIDSNKLRITSLAVDETALEVFDGDGVERCAKSYTSQLGPSEKQQNARLVANGVSPDLLRALGEVMGEVNLRLRHQSSLIRFAERAKLATFGEPIAVLPGDILNLCKPRSISL